MGKNQAKELTEWRIWIHVLHGYLYGLITYPSKPRLLVVSQPADLKKRRDLTIRVSKNEGETWNTVGLLEAGGATYSDLAVLPDKTIICLYGHGGTAHMPQKVSVARFCLD